MELNATLELLRSSFDLDDLAVEPNDLAEQLEGFLSNHGVDTRTLFNPDSAANVLTFALQSDFIAMPPTDFFSGWDIFCRDDALHYANHFSYVQGYVYANEFSINGLIALGLYFRVLEILKMDI